MYSRSCERRLPAGINGQRNPVRLSQAKAGWVHDSVLLHPCGMTDGGGSDPDQVNQADGIGLAARYADAHALQIGGGDLDGAQRIRRIQLLQRCPGLGWADPDREYVDKHHDYAGIRPTGRGPGWHGYGRGPLRHEPGPKGVVWVGGLVRM